MNCNDFEAIIDRYLDGALDSDAWRGGLEHTAACKACDMLVTSYQQASALLKTAVTDRVAAVDVSGLWEAIDVQSRPGRRAVLSAPPRFVEYGFLVRVRAWVASVTPLRIGASLATAAAAFALILASMSTETAPERVARGGLRTKTKAVRIETMEIPSGYTVSTWSRPRSRTHMISINQAPEYTVASVSH